MVQTVEKTRNKEKKKQTKDLYEQSQTGKLSINIRFGHSVHMVRLERRISQDILATRAQLSRNYLSDIERGKRNITLQVVERIARALDVDVAELFL